MYTTKIIRRQEHQRVENPQRWQTASWPDSRLILAVQSEPPNEAALDALTARYWDAVFIRCRMLTLNHEEARDLAQETWCRLLRKRHMLKPDGNLRAYLITIAVNLFRDTHRSAKRAGLMADHRLLSLEAEFMKDEGKAISLGEVLPDLNTLRVEEQAQLQIDISEALELLPPHLREIVVSRFIVGESCAEIALRHGHTEQTISGWVRKALQKMKAHLDLPSITSHAQLAKRKSRFSLAA